MSDAAMPPTGPYRPGPGRRRAHRPLSLEGLPTAEEEAQHAERHKGDAADRFTLYRPEQIEQETRTVRLDMSFGDVVKIRDQAEMVIACMQLVIGKTREHDIGSVRQRIGARAEAASLGRALALFNGKRPYGYSKKKG
jgi:hypothetical protein